MRNLVAPEGSVLDGGYGFDPDPLVPVAFVPLQNTGANWQALPPETRFWEQDPEAPDSATPNTTPATPTPILNIPTLDEARAIVRQFYLNILGRESEGQQHTDFWANSFINEIQNKGISFGDALENLRTAFTIAKTADYEKPFQPVSLLDSINGMFSNSGATRTPSGDFVVVPQDTGGGGNNTTLIIILALIGDGAGFASTLSSSCPSLAVSLIS